MLIQFNFVSLFICISFAAELPTNYEYYTKGGIKSGLIAEGDNFHLNGKVIQVFAGCFHPFRVHPDRWNSTILKMRAAGLNAVEFYTAWNLHELTPGHFDFETGTQDLKRFFKLIKENDMFAVLRAGPFINAEWEMGGFPSWLLRDPNIKFRINNKQYLAAVDKYWSKLFAVAKDYQFSVNGGPIIAIQIENEYGGNLHNRPDRLEYIMSLVNYAHKYGMKELLFKAGGHENGVIKEVLETISTGGDPKGRLDALKKMQPNRPLYVYEMYPGWFDTWTHKHNTKSVQIYANTLNYTVYMNASFGIYMFIGGTNFGWMAAGHGNLYSTTSYDYDAPLTESGNYTNKYYKTIEIFEKHAKDHNLPQIRKPNPPPVEKSAHYGVVKVTEQISLNQLVSHVQSYKEDVPIHPELLNIGKDYGQLFGFTLYRTTIPKSKTLHFQKGQIKDRANLIVDGQQSDDHIVNSGKGFSINLDQTAFTKSGNEHILDILTENTGRDHGDLENQKKGINEEVLIDGKVHKNWEMFPLDFKQDFLDKVKKDKWSPITSYKEPTLFKASLNIKDEPKDTYLKLDGWHTTVVFINDFNVGRYWNVGPQKTLYIPAPVLNKGVNEILLFETTGSSNHIEFIDYPILG